MLKCLTNVRSMNISSILLTDSVVQWMLQIYKHFNDAPATMLSYRPHCPVHLMVASLSSSPYPPQILSNHPKIVKLISTLFLLLFGPIETDAKKLSRPDQHKIEKRQQHKIASRKKI